MLGKGAEGKSIMQDMRWEKASPKAKRLTLRCQSRSRWLSSCDLAVCWFSHWLIRFYEKPSHQVVLLPSTSRWGSVITKKKVQSDHFPNWLCWSSVLEKPYVSDLWCGLIEGATSFPNQIQQQLWLVLSEGWPASPKGEVGQPQGPYETAWSSSWVSEHRHRAWLTHRSVPICLLEPFCPLKVENKLIKKVVQP